MTALSPTSTDAPSTPPGKRTTPSPMRHERETTARGWTRVAAVTPDALRSWKSVTRRSSAEFPTPTTAASIVPALASAATSSSRPTTPGPGARSVKPVTVHPHSAARSATARPWPPAPRISSRPAMTPSPPAGRERRAALPQQQLGQEKVPLGIDVDRSLEALDHATVVLAEDVSALHERRVTGDVHGARGLVDRRGALAPDVPVPLREEGHGAVAVERLHEVGVVGGLGQGLRRVRACLDYFANGLIDLGARAEGRGRLERDDQVGPHAGRGLEPAHRVLEDGQHTRLVRGELGRAQEGDFGPVAPRLLRDLRAVRRDDKPREQRRLDRKGDRLSDERERP